MVTCENEGHNGDVMMSDKGDNGDVMTSAMVM